MLAILPRLQELPNFRLGPARRGIFREDLVVDPDDFSDVGYPQLLQQNSDVLQIARARIETSWQACDAETLP